MASPISEIRYLKQANLQGEQLLQKGWFRELIQHYGVDLQYFRLMTDFYSDSAAQHKANWTYGESTTSTYELSAPIVALVKVDSDMMIFKKFGIETTTNAEIYMMKEDFTEQFRDLIGTPTSAYFSSDLIGAISGFSGFITGSVINSDLSGITSAYVEVPSGTISGSFVGTFRRYPKAVNDRLKVSDSFNDRIVYGSMNGVVSGTIDLSGNGSMTGTATGNLRYYTETPLSGAPHWKIAPQVGDFFRMAEFDSDIPNYLEYQISDVLDRDLAPNGVNPLIRRYLWKCSIVRRTPSMETVSGTTQQEALTPNYLDNNTWQQVISNQTFDYDNNDIDTIDKANSDDVYGGF